MTNQYLFRLGRETLLNLAEVLAVLGHDGLLIAHHGPVALFELPEHTDLQALQERLAGTVKIGRVIAELPAPTNLASLVEYVASDLLARPVRDFGFSFFGNHLSLKQRDRLGIQLKKSLKAAGHASRFVASKDLELSSVLVRDQLLTHGREYLLAQFPDRWIVSETVTVQDWQSWSRRDYGRPVRDARRGMLPPKLARLMINLGQFPMETTLLDPFCGVGTVLQEAWLLGYQTVTGSDSDDRAVAAAQTNLDWLRAAQPRLYARTINLRTISLEELADGFQREKMMSLGIVTEPDLGPPNLAELPPPERATRFRTLTERYRLWLTACHRLLQPGERCVMIIPFLRAPLARLAVLPENQDDWHLVVPLLPARQAIPNLEAPPALTYARPDQMIGREIYVLQKN